MKDKIMTCIQCNEPFVFTAEERKRNGARGFDEPRRCPDCRKKKSKDTPSNQPWKDKGRKRHGHKKSRDDSGEDI